jgi:hypothetical protein
VTFVLVAIALTIGYGPAWSQRLAEMRRAPLQQAPSDPEGGLREMKQVSREPRGELVSALRELAHPELERREAAVAAINALVATELATTEVEAILASLCAGLPPARFDFAAYDGMVLLAMSAHVQESHIPLLVDAYPKLTEQGRAACLATFAKAGTAPALEAYVSVLRAHGWPAWTFPVMTTPLEEQPRFGRILVPALIDGSIQPLPRHVRDRLLLG